MTFPFLGFGIGLRKEHYEYLLRRKPDVDWLEVSTEEYLDAGGRSICVLEHLKERYPIALHGVSMSLGSTDPLDRHYLKLLKRLARRVNPAWISDHLSWSSVGGRHLHELFPLPYTEEALEHTVRRICRVQDFLGTPILVENVCSYMILKEFRMTEWEFLKRVSMESGCGILLDINNVYISSLNHAFDPLVYIDTLPSDRILQFHLGGHRRQGAYTLDTHDRPVSDPVWKLYEHAQRRHGGISTSIEWDDRVPGFPQLIEESKRAKRLGGRVFHVA